jgi:4-amino-4-deoxy-L-arabinose transferase-like glycosyltransferase
MGVAYFTLRDFLLMILFFLLSILVWSFFYQNQSQRAIYNPDAYSFAVTAKEVAEGNGFQTKSLILPQLEYLRQTGKDVHRWDSLYNFPFPVIVMSQLFLLWGTGDFSISLSSGIFYFLSAPLVYLIARKRFNRSVAYFSSMWFILFPHILRYSISGMTELPSIFFTLLLIYLFAFEQNRFTLLCGGLALGLFYLNRHTALIFLPLFLALIYQVRPPFRWKNWAYFLVPFMAVTFPWLIHMHRLTGDPFFHLGATVLLLTDTALFPDFHLSLYPYYSSPLEFILKHPEVIAVKYLKESFLINWVFFAVFLFLRKKVPKFDRRILWLFIIFALAQPLFGNNPRYYAFFAPFIMIYIIAMGESLLRRYSFAGPALRVALLSGLIALTSLGSLNFIWHGLRGETVPGRGSGLVEHRLHNMKLLNGLLDKQRLTATDISSEVAWYTDSEALILPPDPDSLTQFEQKYGLSLDQIYLTPGVYISGLSPPGWAKWEAVRHQGELSGYETKYRFSNGSLLLTKASNKNG